MARARNKTLQALISGCWYYLSARMDTRPGLKPHIPSANHQRVDIPSSTLNTSAGYVINGICNAQGRQNGRIHYRKSINVYTMGRGWSCISTTKNRDMGTPLTGPKENSTCRWSSCLQPKYIWEKNLVMGVDTDKDHMGIRKHRRGIQRSTPLWIWVGGSSWIICWRQNPQLDWIITIEYTPANVTTYAFLDPKGTGPVSDMLRG